MIRALVLAILLASLAWSYAYPHDSGQWENADPAIHEWYKNLMRPDCPTCPCCAEADAYYADIVHVRDGKTYAVVTDDRDDKPLGRPHIPPGTEFEVPPERLKFDNGNPTGHNVLFIASATGYSQRDNATYCFVQAGGV
jgi:hypothetical protein